MEEVFACFVIFRVMSYWIVLDSNFLCLILSFISHDMEEELQDDVRTSKVESFFSRSE